MNIETITGWFRVLLTPTCWLQNNPYSEEWERILQKLLATERFTEYDGYHAKLGTTVLWVENHPYASMRPDCMPVRPKRSTILRAHDKLVRDTYDCSNPLSIEQARKLRVCRYCLKSDSPEPSNPLILAYGEDYAHEKCVPTPPAQGGGE